MTNQNDRVQTETEQPISTKASRRDFLKRYGKYAAATPVAMTTLMAPGKVSAACSEGLNQCLVDNGCINPAGNVRPGCKDKVCGDCTPP